MIRRLCMIVALLLLSVASTVAQTDANSQLQTLAHDDNERSYELYLPDNPDGLLVALHPFGSSGKAMQVLTGLDAIGEANNWAVAYPNSDGFYWDDGRAAANLPPDTGAVDDIGFLETLVDTLVNEHDLNADEVYLTGIANGGTMAFTAACQLPERFAGVAVVGALMWSYQVENCAESDSAPFDLLVMHGEQDHIYYADGRTLQGTSDAAWQILSADETRAFWAGRNGCDPASQQIYRGTTVTQYSDCAGESTVAFHNVLGGGNTWFRSGTNINPENIVNASAILSLFFTDDERWYTRTIQDEAPQATPRSFILYVPSSYDPQTPMPLMVLLHGRTVSATHQVYASNMNAIAEREGFIAVYPDAINTEWNYGKDIALYGTQERLDDEAFLASLLADLRADLSIDDQRVYVTGLSNGGFMTQRLACTMQETFAAFASVAATAPFGLTQVCEGAAPSPLMMINGTDDQIVPFGGVTTELPNGQEVYLAAPVENSVAFWRDHNGCGSDYTRTTLDDTLDDGTTTNIFRARNCPDGAPVELYLVDGGGHAWLGVRDLQNPTLGTSTADFNSSEVIWEFFQEFTLESRPEPAPTTEPTPAPTTEPTTVPADDSEDSATTQAEAERAQFIIDELRTGQYTLVFVPAAGSECALDDAERVRLQGAADVFAALAIPIGRVVSDEACLAQSTATVMFDSVDQTVGFDAGNALLLLARPATEAGNTIIVMPRDLLRELGADVNAGSASFIVQPRGDEGFAILSQVPAGGWQTLADLVQSAEE